ADAMYFASGSKSPLVYEVTPEGGTEDDPDFEPKGVSFACPKAKIIAVYNVPDHVIQYCRQRNGRQSPEITVIARAVRFASGHRSGARHLIERAPAIVPAGGLLANAAPLLEEKCRPRLATRGFNLRDPLLSHRTRTRAALAADDGPLDAR